MSDFDDEPVEEIDDEEELDEESPAVESTTLPLFDAKDYFKSQDLSKTRDDREIEFSDVIDSFKGLLNTQVGRDVLIITEKQPVAVKMAEVFDLKTVYARVDLGAYSKRKEPPFRKRKKFRKIIDPSNVKKSEEKRKMIKEIEFFFGDYKGSRLMIISARGHLLTLNLRMSSLPQFNFAWKIKGERKSAEKDEEKKGREAEVYFIAMMETIPIVNEVIVATDNDDEGELIGYNIVRFNDALSKTKRMVFQALTQKELRYSFDNLTSIQLNKAKAAELRTWVDYALGKNLSRFLSTSVRLALKQEKGYIELPYGRVKTIIHNALIKNVRKIENTKRLLASIAPKTVYSFALSIPTFKAHYKDLEEVQIPEEDRFGITLDKALELEKKYKGSIGKVIEIKDRVQEIEAENAGLRIDEIRTWAYKQGIDFTRTDAILESLYLSGVITYPRSDSDVLPNPALKDVSELHRNIEDDYHELKLRALLEAYSITPPIDNLAIPRMGERHDGAHWAIHPTGIEAFERDELSREESMKNFKDFVFTLPPDYRLIYDFIVNRYIAGFCKNKRIKEFLYTFEINSLPSPLEMVYYREVLDYGWESVIELDFANYVYRPEDQVPKIDIGDVVHLYTRINSSLVKLDEEGNQIHIPDRMSKGDIFDYMVNHDLGTDATRTSLMQELWNDKFVTGDPPIPTILGMRILEALTTMDINQGDPEHPDYLDLLSPSLTRLLEQKKQLIIDGKEVIETLQGEIERKITRIIDVNRSKMEAIGSSLIFFGGECPYCASRMMIVKAKKGDEFFVFLSCEKRCGFTASM